MKAQRISKQVLWLLTFLLIGALLISVGISLLPYHSVDIRDIDTFLYEKPRCIFKAGEAVTIKLKPREDVGIILQVNGRAVYGERCYEEFITYRFQMPRENVYLSVMLLDKINE